MQPGVSFSEEITALKEQVSNRYQHNIKLQHHKPDDYSDVGQAEVFVAKYGDIIRWTPGLGFLVFDGRRWKVSDSDAREYSQNLTEIQKREARKAVHAANDSVMYAKEHGNAADIDAAKEELARAEKYFAYAISQRKSPRVTATLTEAGPRLAVEIDVLDKDAFLLNTPTGTVDLRTGIIKENDPDDLCTHITAVGPDRQNKEVFESFLRELTSNDRGLQDFLQEVAGMCAIGKVYTEIFIICQGSGGNGKSTFFNLLQKVLGDYSVSMPSKALTTNFDERVTLMLNESLRGKRLAIYPELADGSALDSAAIKKIASTDTITANPKHRKPFSFTPSHTPILFTNPLPRVTSMDAGTWDRLILVPFRARFRKKSGEVMNYADVLFDQCGGYVLQWIIDGAKRFIENGFKLKPCKVVSEATQDFHEKNDWFFQFQTACCVVGEGYSITARELYNAYLQYCNFTQISPYNATNFGKAYKAAGFIAGRRSGGMLIGSIQIRPDWKKQLEAKKAAYIETQL